MFNVHIWGPYLKAVSHTFILKVTVTIIKDYSRNCKLSVHVKFTKYIAVAVAILMQKF